MKDVGFAGSSNTYGWFNAGARDVVTNGGVVIYPKNIVVADGDGVIVVPQDVAVGVAKYAKQIQDGDKASRQRHYEKAGRTPDFMVQ